MNELKRKILEDMGYDKWIVDPDGTLVCPCGYRIEDDGECPEGHVSPMKQMALI